MSDKKSESPFFKIISKKIYRRILEELAVNALTLDELHVLTGYNKSELLRRLRYLMSIRKICFEDSKYFITSDDLKNAFRELME